MAEDMGSADCLPMVSNIPSVLCFVRRTHIIIGFGFDLSENSRFNNKCNLDRILKAINHMAVLKGQPPAKFGLLNKGHVHLLAGSVLNAHVNKQ